MRSVLSNRYLQSYYVKVIYLGPSVGGKTFPLNKRTR